MFIGEPPLPMDTSHITRKWLDIPYGTQSPAQKMDIYLPEEGDGPFPVIASIHGGAWMFGDKGDTQNIPFLKGVERGYAVVCINYRLSSEAQFPNQIYDCKAAIRFLRANADKYSLKGKHIGVWGSSAGGHLAALLGTSAKAAGLDDLSTANTNLWITSQVQAAVIWYGPIESFLAMDEELIKSEKGVADHSSEESPESRLLGRKITEVPAMVRFASPMTYINENIPPFLLQHGGMDEIVPVEQSIHFAREVERIAGANKVVLEVLARARHADPKFETTANVNRVLDFLDLYLK